MKKKILVSTLAAGLVFSTISGLPLSNKGLGEKLGLSTVVNAVPAPLPSAADQLVARMNDLYGVMTTTERNQVSTARDNVNTIKNGYVDGGNNTTWLTLYGELIDPVWSRILTKIQQQPTYQSATAWGSVNKEKVLFLVLSLTSINYDMDYTQLETLRNDPVLRPVMNDLAKLGGLANGIDDLSFSDLTTFTFAVENATKTALLNITSFTALLNIKETIKTNVQTIIDARATNTAILLDNTGITAADVNAVKTAIESKVAGAEAAANAFIAAYSRLILSEQPTPPSSGGSTTPTTPTTPTGPTTPPVVTTPNIGEIVSGVQDTLKDLKDQLQGATDEEKQQIIAEAKEAIQQAVQDLSQVNVSATITVADGKATPKLDTATLVNQLKTIKEETKKLNDSMKDLDATAKPVQTVVKINLGTVSASSTEVPLAKELLSAAAAEGIDLVAIEVNGLTLALDPKEFTEDTSLTISTEADSVATDATNLPLASQVFNFGMTVGGKEVEKFSKPIVVQVPVNNADQYDDELLVLAKIVDGKLVIYGGQVVDGVLVVERKSFSSYVVVENKVTFNDIEKVRAWAGRFIEVVAAKGIINGRGNDKYAPSDNVTRAEFAAMLVRTFGLEDDTLTENFEDVKDGVWFQPYVAAAVESGIINGRSKDTFDPSANITRAEMAIMTARALKAAKAYQDVDNVDGELASFNDAAAIGAAYKQGVALAVNAGLIIGEPSGNFNPNRSSTRAEAAVVIYRALNAE